MEKSLCKWIKTEICNLESRKMLQIFLGHIFFSSKQKILIYRLKLSQIFYFVRDVSIINSGFI